MNQKKKAKLGMLDDLDIKGPVKENPDHCKQQSEFLALVFITEETACSNRALREKSLKNYFHLKHE